MRKTITALILVLAGANAMALEEPDYDVLLTVGDIEFRRYEPYVLAQVTVSGEAQDRKAFRILAGSIFGDNDDGEKMKMTAPVETRGSDYAFVMESKYSLDSLPHPNDDRIRLFQRDTRVVAALKFSGRWTNRNVQRHEQRILTELDAMQVKATGSPELARYNSPFTPWFMRRNEILVPIDWASVKPEEIIASALPARL